MITGATVPPQPPVRQNHCCERVPSNDVNMLRLQSKHRLVTVVGLEVAFRVPLIKVPY